jgi:hypothetical protein
MREKDQTHPVVEFIGLAIILVSIIVMGQR